MFHGVRALDPPSAVVLRTAAARVPRAVSGLAARTAGAVPCIGDGSNHWALVHVDDIAELYVLALNAPAGSVYAGVSGQNPPLTYVTRALGQAAGCPGRIDSLTLEEAVQRMGPIAEAFALDQQFSGAKARRELGWTPTRLDALAELAQG
ncbi:hypothetical protein J7E99_05325 [Streptomyces sp. ISL-44]|uniref:hypothetical protein n=1 Tax=Streptomyces sp. ISL-44 TaxID=2819184 RepID=UPI001BEB320E|nr:hypothetical protein [Streptomyces sp. ISL-44]MBT2540140.1 hypothetical protein [Streptomyces sp. ISL-44]